MFSISALKVLVALGLLMTISTFCKENVDIPPVSPQEVVNDFVVEPKINIPLPIDY